MGVTNVTRIEMFRRAEDGEHPIFDPMLEMVYRSLHTDLLTIEESPKSDDQIADIRKTNSETDWLSLTTRSFSSKRRAKNLGRR